MILKNHIAHRLLNDEELILKMLEATYPGELQKTIESNGKYSHDELAVFYSILNGDDQKAYYITETVTKQFENLKIKSVITDGVEHYDWTYFKHLKDQKITFILPDNSVLRFVVNDNMLDFCHIFGRKDITNVVDSFTLFNVERFTGERSDNFEHPQIKSLEKYVYSLLCFFYLTDNEIIEIEPGQKHESKKSGKFINSLDDIPVTIVNSRWNITVIRTEGFTVSGHFATRWTGAGRTIPKLIFVSPFEKNGYIRKAKSLSNV